MDNPFDGVGATIAGDRITGREDKLGRLERILSGSRGSYSIIGPPRVGKTSLVKEAARRARAAHPTLPIVELSLERIPDTRSLFASILDKLLDQADALGLPLPSRLGSIRARPAADAEQAFDRCEEGLYELCKAKVRSVLVLDELDRINRLGMSNQTVDWLVFLAKDPDRFGVTMVVISRRSLGAIQRKTDDVSTLYGVCNTLRVGPLSREGLGALARHCGTDWSPTDAEVDELFRYTGGLPYLAESVLYHAWEARSFARGLEETIPTFFNYYSHLHGVLRDEDAYDQLLQIVIGPQHSVRPEAERALLDYALIREQTLGGDRVRYVAWSEHYQDYLETCVRIAPVWDLWRDFETALREFISDICRQGLGADWLTQLASHKYLGPILDECRARHDKARKRFGAHASDNLLDYSYPKDQWAIIATHWDELFGRHFGAGKKPYWSKLFDTLAGVRGPLAHFQPLDAQTIRDVESACTKFLEVIRRRSDEVALDTCAEPTR